MNSDWIIFVLISIIIIGLSLWGGPFFLYRENYFSRVVSSKEISQLPDLIIPPEIILLIARFDPSIKVRIADDADAIPQAANFRQNPAYVIISRYALEQTIDDATQLKTKHLLAVVAHELGHIVLASKSTWLLEMCTSGFVGALLFLLLTLVNLNWTSSIYSLLALVIIARTINTVSRFDEYRADAFAITDALIPTTDLAEALLAMKLHIAKRTRSSTGQAKFMNKVLISIVGNSHPSLENRIHRMQILLGNR